MQVFCTAMTSQALLAVRAHRTRGTWLLARASYVSLVLPKFEILPSSSFPMQVLSSPLKMLIHMMYHLELNFVGYSSHLYNFPVICSRYFLPEDPDLHLQRNTAVVFAFFQKMATMRNIAISYMEQL
eukprot:TRINITY_DN5408_c0_g1_i1.p2 TRINITY_DN5408_c0_g1~~TRINITY_DN5408_c0_g1_i1.p2  ORF type:complete len:127 (-),score=16.46 TRINITY_DN5408_c0_g1_i1:29-409(-)